MPRGALSVVQSFRIKLKQHKCATKNALMACTTRAILSVLSAIVTVIVVMDHQAFVRLAILTQSTLSC